MPITRQHRTAIHYILLIGLLAGPIANCQLANCQTADVVSASTETTSGDDLSKSSLAPSYSLKSVRAALRRQQMSIDRHANINPEHPSKGIRTGLVIAYGHLILPPYEIEYRGSTFTINGVPISPNPVRLREQEKDRARLARIPKASQKEINDNKTAAEALTRAEEFYREKKGRISDQDLQKEILKMLSGLPAIVDAKWSSDTTLTFKHKFRNHYVPTLDHFSTNTPEPPETEDQRQARQSMNRSDHIAIIESRLENGEGLFFLSTGGVIAVEPNISEKVTAIMGNPAFNETEKRDALETVLNNFEAALDVLANYKADEWQHRQRK